MLALSVHNLSVQYQQQKVLENVHLQVPKGSITGIIGPNGAGKSTLMKAILGLVPITEGKVNVLEQPFTQQKDLIGYVPQRSEVDWDFPINALDVVLMGRYKHFKRFRPISKQEKDLAMTFLKEIGMETYANRQISQLSGGQQQRVFLARALAQNTPIYFMDEPFAGVDAATEKMMIQLMKQWKNDGKTVIIVHHDLQTVQEYFDHVLLLNKKTIGCGKTSDVFQPQNIERTYGGSLTFPPSIAGNSL
ncbi:metal ABC transporter ATP-binding protein [Gracilibacillus saliphilus]|uniref:metal ABC transporter ATP-binding protein n=1 Tax=Gracilibacillus saliphilus TaxID=543890 RepID=UPI0013D20424|nr:metal ABC transporter ATP-binding protein [Gracilibacillus saliphilus]